jgi:hypothetical protein
MDVFGYLIIILLLLIAVLTIWNILLFRKIKSHLEIKDKIAENSVYFDLKYRLNLITSIAAIVITVITFFGYNQFNNIERDLGDQFNSKFEKYESFFSSLNSQKDSLINNYNSLTQKSTIMNNTINDSENKIKNVSAKIDIISQDILTNNLFIVKNIFFNLKEFKLGREIIKKRYYYKDLLTLENNSLPIFTTPPSLNIIPTNGAVFSLIDNTTDYFDVELQSSNEDSLYFEVWIIVKNTKK